MPSRQQLSGDRFPLAVLGDAVGLSHRFTLSDRDVEELLLQRGVAVTHRRERTPMRTPLLRESLRTWCIKFSDHFARWHLDEMCLDVGGVNHGLFWARTDALLGQNSAHEDA